MAETSKIKHLATILFRNLHVFALSVASTGAAPLIFAEQNPPITQPHGWP